MSVTHDGRRRPSVELYGPPPARRSLSPSDALRALIGVLLIALGGLLAVGARQTVRGIERDLVTAFTQLPETVQVFTLLTLQLLVSLVPVVALVTLLAKQRWRVAGLMVLAAVLAWLGLQLADAIVIEGDVGAFVEELGSDTQPPLGRGFPDSGVIAAMTALVVVVGPWIGRRWRRALWGAVAVLVVMRLLVVAPPFNLVVAIGVGTFVGSVLLLAFGAPATEPQPEDLLAALRRSGFDPAAVDRVGAQGDALHYRFYDRDGDHFAVKLRSPESRDAEILARMWRRLRYRSSEVAEAYPTPQRRLEHEALGLMLAHRSGARVPPVVRLGRTERDSVFLVTPALPLRPATAEDLAVPGFLEDMWTQVRALHDVGLAHRRLGLEALHVDDDRAGWLLDFDRSHTAATERERARDVAQLLVETAIVVGPDDAVAAATTATDAAAVAPALRMLQPLAMPRSTRRRAKEAEGDLFDQLRASVTDATGQTAVELEPLERVKPRTALIIGASALAFYSLLPQFATFGETIDAFAGAEPVWLVAALAAAVISYPFAALSLQGSVPDALPYGPAVRAQVAADFAGLVGPAGTGGMALMGRFLQRNGVAVAAAGASVVANAAGGFIVHMSLMAMFFVWAGSAAIGGFSLPDSQTILLGLAVVMALVGILAAVGPVRRRVLAPVWNTVRSGIRDVGPIFRRPLRVVQLLGGSAGITLAYVCAVAACVQAFGGGLAFAQIGAAYLGAMAIATFAPTPGGLGAVESAIIAALTGFGLASGPAVSATLTFRLVTFWLPMLPGWLLLNAMQRNEEL